MTDITKLSLDDLKKLGLDDIESLQALITEAKQEKEKEAFQELCSSVEQAISDSPFSINDVFQALGSGKKQKKKVAPKYQNTEDASQTWTGRGRKPSWLVEALEAGKALEDFLIANEVQENLL